MLTIKQKMRSAHVHRWHTVRTMRPQNIAEHMYRVWLLTRALCERFGLSSDAGAWAEMYALTHDLAEVETGDIITPTKSNALINNHLKAIEATVDPETSEFEEWLSVKYPEALVVVKLADQLEAIDFLEIEGVGRHAGEVLVGMWNGLQGTIDTAAKEHPHICWANYRDVYKDLR